MKIILNEDNFLLMLNNIINESFVTKDPLSNKINLTDELLEKLITNNGNIMVNIKNQKLYAVYEDAALTNMIGKRVCICRLLKDNKPYGPIYVKPMDLFKIKTY